jgi:hypothetical protein
MLENTSRPAPALRRATPRHSVPPTVRWPEARPLSAVVLAVADREIRRWRARGRP